MFFETLTLVCYIDPSTRYCHFCFGISSLLSLFRNFKLVGFISSLCYSKSVRRYFIFYNTNSNNIRCRFVCYCIMNKTHMILIAFIRIYLKIRTILCTTKYKKYSLTRIVREALCTVRKQRENILIQGTGI